MCRTDKYQNGNHKSYPTAVRLVQMPQLKCCVHTY